MNHSTDIIWNEITNSAKTRFDYNSFKQAFDDEVGEKKMPENILCMTIAGYAEGQSNNEIAAKIESEMTCLGILFSDGDLQTFLENKQTELKCEVVATTLAANLLNQGWQVPDVLIQVQRILE